MGLIGRSGSEQVMLPTLQELCDRLSVSRPTVCKALKELTQQGYIISKRGVGSFTNPAKCQHFEKMNLPHVGLVLGDGMISYLTRYNVAIFWEMIKQLVAMPVVVQQINLGSFEQTAVRSELLNEKLDLFVWLCPPTETEEFYSGVCESGLPAICVEPVKPFKESVQLDYEN